MDNNIITHHGMDIEIQHRQSLGEAHTLMHGRSGRSPEPSPSHATQLTAVPGEDTGGAENSQTQHVCARFGRRDCE